MTTQQMIIFILLGVAVLLLGAYLGYLIVKIQVQKKELIERKKKEVMASRERDAYLKESILIIAKATLQEQCELSEACIRIKKLIENYPTIESRDEHQVIQKMYRDLSGFSYLEERKTLTKQERYNQDKKRFTIEDEYKGAMHESLNLLVEQIQ